MSDAGSLINRSITSAVPPMSTPEQNRQIVIDAYACLERGDTPGFYASFAPQACLVEAESLPGGGVYQGLDALKAAIARRALAWPEMTVVVDTITCGGELCFVHLSTTRTAPSGRATGFPLLELWRFQNGKVVELRPIHWDTHRLREAYGL